MKHEKHARTARYQNSTIIDKQKLLNKYVEEKRKFVEYL